MNPSPWSDVIVQKITIRGSAERIFEALTNPQQRMRWWGGPGRFPVAHMESDLRPGGKWSMSGTGMGHPFRVESEHREVERPRLLVFNRLTDWQPGAVESWCASNWRRRTARPLSG